MKGSVISLHRQATGAGHTLPRELGGLQPLRQASRTLEVDGGLIVAEGLWKGWTLDQVTRRMGSSWLGSHCTFQERFPVTTGWQESPPPVCPPQPCRALYRPTDSLAYQVVRHTTPQGVKPAGDRGVPVGEMRVLTCWLAVEEISRSSHWVIGEQSFEIIVCLEQDAWCCGKELAPGDTVLLPASFGLVDLALEGGRCLRIRLP